MGIKKHLNSFKVENDQLMYITDMSKKRVVTSPAERVKLIRDAHIHGGITGYGIHFDHHTYSNKSTIILCLLVSSADNICKLFGSRSGPTKCRA